MPLLLILSLALLLPGSAMASERIIGGQSDVLHPSRVALVGAGDNSYESFFCGGTLVRPRWVLTAAHCVDSSAIDVVVGRRNLKKRSGERIAVVAKRVHPLYQLSSLRNDIALLRLSRAPRRFTTAPIAEAIPGSKGIVAGWGYTLNTRPALIYSAKASVAPDNDCRWTYGSFFDRETMFCTQVSGQSICQGDSGSGLLVDGRVVGIVSYSPPGCIGYPDGYARINQDWSKGVFAEKGPWRTRKTRDPAYEHLPPLASYIFSTEDGNKGTVARLSFYSNYSLEQATIRAEGKEVCVLPSCPPGVSALQPEVGRREWKGEVVFRGCVKLYFRGLVAEGRHRGRWMGTQEVICS